MDSLGIYLVLLIVAASLFLVVPVWRYQKRARTAAAGEARKQKNIEIFRENLLELEQSLNDGLIEQEEYEKLKLEQEKNFLGDMEDHAQVERQRWASHTKLVPLVLVLIIPIGSFLLYRAIGSGSELALPELRTQLSNAETQEEQLRIVNDMLEIIDDSFQRDPDDIQTGYSLGTMYLNLERYQNAIGVFSELASNMTEEGNNKAAVLGQLAQARYLAADSTLTPEVQRTIDEALALNSNQPAVMSILAREAFINEEYEQAIDYWRRQISQLPVGSPQIERINQTITRVEQLMGVEQQSGVEQPADSGVSVTVNVRLDDALRDGIPDGMRLFVFARSEDIQFPLAVANLSPDELPVTVTLDDSMATPMPQAPRLSSAETVYVVARIAADATTPSGFEAVSGSFDPAQRDEPVELVIQRTQPQ